MIAQTIMKLRKYGKVNYWNNMKIVNVGAFWIDSNTELWLLII
jgi:hypothetical protein